MVDVAHVRARAEKGEERFRAGTIQATHQVIFHIRHRDDLAPTWEIVWRGRRYNVTAFANFDERRRFLSIEATAAT